MGNICQNLFGTPTSGYAATERSGLLANQHASTRGVVSQSASSAAAEGSGGGGQQRVSESDRGTPPYTARSVTNNRTRSFDNSDLTFDKIGLENLDKRLADIATLFNVLLERHSNLKTGLLQLEQLGKQVCAKTRTNQSATSDDAGGDVIGRAFECLARQAAQTANSAQPITVKLKENAKNWLEAVFDSKCLQYDDISFLNLYNLLGRYAWELRSKVPPLRNTVAMTTQEEETFRRDLLVASLNSEANAFGANFGRLRRVDERLGEFEKLGADAGERLAAAGRRLMA